MSSGALVGEYKDSSKGIFKGEIYLSPDPIMDEFSREAEQSKVFLTYFLNLPPAKALKFSLSVGLGIGRNFSPIQKNNCLMLLPPV